MPTSHCGSQNHSSIEGFQIHSALAYGAFCQTPPTQNRNIQIFLSLPSPLTPSLSHLFPPPRPSLLHFQVDRRPRRRCHRDASGGRRGGGRYRTSAFMHAADRPRPASASSATATASDVSYIITICSIIHPEDGRGGGKKSNPTLDVFVLFLRIRRNADQAIEDEAENEASEEA